MKSIEMKGQTHVNNLLASTRPGRNELDYFDKRMAVEVIEDSLTDLTTPNSRGMATGLCGAFYLCGLLSAEEWAAYLQRIPAESFMARGEGLFETKDPGQMIAGGC